jgi:hypothetical protein
MKIFKPIISAGSKNDVKAVCDSSEVVCGERVLGAETSKRGELC